MKTSLYTVCLTNRDYSKLQIIRDVPIEKMTDLCGIVYGRDDVRPGMYISRYFIQR